MTATRRGSSATSIRNDEKLDVTAKHPSIHVRLLAQAEPDTAEPDLDIHLLVAKAVEAHARADGRLDIEEAADSVVPDDAGWLLRQVQDLPELLDWPLLCAVPDTRAAIRLAIVGEVSRRVARATQSDVAPAEHQHRRHLRRQNK